MMINFPNWIPDKDIHSPALQDLFNSSTASVCSTMAFIPLENHVIPVSTNFLSKGDALFHQIPYDYSCSDWDGLHKHLRDTACKELSVSAVDSEFCEWVCVEIDAYFPHHKYQVKSNSSLLFLAACVATIAHKNLFFFFSSSFPHTARLPNSLPRECFSLTYDLNGFKSRINRHLLTVGLF